MSQVSASARAQRFLAQEEAWARRVLTRSSLAWWTASISGKPGDYARMERAHRAVNRHYSRPATYQRLVRLSGAAELDRLTRRRMERLQRAYQSKQAPVEMLNRITK